MKIKTGQLVWVVAGGKKFRGDVVAVGKLEPDKAREAEREMAFKAADQVPGSLREQMRALVEAQLPQAMTRVADGVTADVNYYSPDRLGDEVIVGGLPEAKLVDEPTEGAKLVDGTWWPRDEKRNGRTWIPATEEV